MTKQPSPRPSPSIKVVAIMFILAGLSGLFNMTSVPIAGFYISGWFGFLLRIVLIGLLSYIGFGLWRLREMARRVAIGYLLYNLLERALEFTIQPQTRDVSIALWNTQGVTNTTIALLLNYLMLSIVPGLFLVFLIKRKSAFGKREG